VRLTHYANLKRDLPGEIRQIASFLDIPIDESRWDAILEHCSFEWMRANAGAGAILEGGGNTFFYRGVNGRWSETLTAEEIAEYEARAVKELGEKCAHWLATGEVS
jgi:aryl sulfotransferase